MKKRFTYLSVMVLVPALCLGATRTSFATAAPARGDANACFASTVPLSCLGTFPPDVPVNVPADGSYDDGHLSGHTCEVAIPLYEMAPGVRFWARCASGGYAEAYRMLNAPVSASGTGVRPAPQALRLSPEGRLHTTSQ